MKADQLDYENNCVITILHAPHKILSQVFFRRLSLLAKRFVENYQSGFVEWHETNLHLSKSAKSTENIYVRSWTKTGFRGNWPEESRLQWMERKVVWVYRIDYRVHLNPVWKFLKVKAGKSIWFAYYVDTVSRTCKAVTENYIRLEPERMDWRKTRPSSCWNAESITTGTNSAHW